SRQVAFDSLDSGCQIALTPTRHLYTADAQLLGDVLVLQSLRGKQNDPGTLRQSHARQTGANELVQLLLLLLRQQDRRGNSQLLAPMQSEVEHWSSSVQISSIKNTTLH